MEQLKVGIIGSGAITRRHIQATMDNPRAQVVALYGRDAQRAGARAQQFSIPKVYTSLPEMLRDDEIQAVNVCTLNRDHAAHAMAALAAGKHVLCEKPMAMNAEEARQMVAAAKKAGKLLMMGYTRRFDRSCLVMEDLIQDGVLGDVYYAKLRTLRRNGFPGGWFGQAALSGGGPLIDLGVHNIDLARYLMGNPKAVSVYGATFAHLKDRPGLKEPRMGYQSAGSLGKSEPFEVEDLATAMIRFDTGAVLFVEMSFTLNSQAAEEEVFELFGTKAGFRVTDKLEIFSQQSGYLTDTVVPYGGRSDTAAAFEGEIANFVDAILDGAPCKAPAEDGLALMEILDAIYEAARTGHEVVLG